MAAFALFKFVQSLGSAIAFLYSTTLNLHYQLYLLAVIASMATLSFCFVEWNCRTKKVGMKTSDSQQDIVKENLAYQKNRNYDSTTQLAKSKGDNGISIN